MAAFLHLPLFIREETLSQKSVAHFLLAQMKLRVFSLAEGKLENYLSLPVYIVEACVCCVCVSLDRQPTVSDTRNKMTSQSSLKKFVSLWVE